MTVEIKTTRCTECRNEYSDAELANAMICPGCGTAGIPMAINQDVTININWHELRILCMWASNHAATFTGESARSQKALASIIRSIRTQFPEMPGLTMAEEIQDLADAFNTTVTKTGGHEPAEIFKPKRGLSQ